MPARWGSSSGVAAVLGVVLLSCSIFCLTEVLCKAVPWDPKAPMASPPLPQHQELIQSCIQSLLPTFPSPGLTFSLPVFLVDKVS